MSSAVLSPHTTALSLELSSRQGASRMRPRPIHSLPNRDSTTSPVPSQPSPSSSGAVRTRSRMSTSPDKALAETEERRGDASITSDDEGFNTQLRSSPGLRSEREEEEEEGEEEIDLEVEPEDDGEEEFTRPPTPENEIEPPKETQRIKLVFGNFGKKRKADGTEVEEAVPTGSETTEPSIQETLQIPEKEQLKRMPRKKRKWLKKGEIDPDDHVAVARQRERHKLIDQALENLDLQYEEVKHLSHESVIWMLEELERRKELQLAQLEARYKAEMGELEHMRDHFRKQFKSDFIVRREELIDEMSEENRQKVSRLKHQNTLLRVVPDTYPASRDGRGGGGWVVPSTHLLSTGEQDTVPIRAGSSRVRMDISIDVAGFDLEVGKADLAKMIPPKTAKHTPTPPPRAAARDKKPVIDTSTETKPAPKLSARPVPAPSASTSTSAAAAAAAARPQPKPQVYTSKSSYAAAPASASYAYQPGTQPDRRPDPATYTPPMPLYHAAANGNPAYLSWEEYRSYAKYDAWGCPLPHDNYRRDLVLRESWEKKLGRIPRDTVLIPGSDAAKRTHSGRGPTGPVTATHQPVTATAGPSAIRPQPATATASTLPSSAPGTATTAHITWAQAEAQRNAERVVRQRAADRQRAERYRVEAEEQRRLTAQRRAEGETLRERLLRDAESKPDYFKSRPLDNSAIMANEARNNKARP